MTTHKYQLTYYIEAPKGINLRDELGTRFEERISAEVQQRIEEELGYEVTLEHSRITEDE
tara:strand:+ start:420 stop:599 length:180 start_codon:yes stop_codon:yes gene_type:complete